MIKKAYVNVPDGQLHYRYSTEGSGAPLVCFHMTAASSGAYELLMRQLEPHMPVIAFDTMNYGESFRTDRKAEISYIAETFLQAMTALGIERFHTFGHHTGVAIQSEMAIQAPDRVLSTVMNGAPYAPLEHAAAFAEQLAVPLPPSIKGTQFMWAWSRIKDFAGTGHRGELPPGIVEAMHRDTVDMLRAGENWHWGYQAVFSYDLPAAVEKIQCPKYFVVGARDVSFPLHEQATKDYPDAPSHVNPDAGVYYIETFPEELAPVVAGYVRDANLRAQS